MRTPTKITEKMFCLTILLLILAFSAGCSLSPARLMGPQYYLIDISDCRLTTQTTDEKIAKCKDEVKGILRERFNNARLARTGGGVLQVLTSGVSAFLLGINGASAVTAATILSGTSSIIPELSEVVEAKGRAEAYNDGLKAIESAEAAYLKRIARSHGGKIPGDKITPAGAELFDKVRAAITVVEQRLTAQLPSLDELQKLASRPLGLSGSAVKGLKKGAKVQVFVTRGGPIVDAQSSDLSKARVVMDQGGGSITIEGIEPGTAEINVENESGGSAKVEVMVVP